MSRYVISNAYPGWFPGLPMFLSRHLAQWHTLATTAVSPAQERGSSTLALRAELRSGHNPKGGAKRDGALPAAPGVKDNDPLNTVQAGA